MELELPQTLKVPLHPETVPFPSKAGLEPESEEPRRGTQAPDWPARWDQSPWDPSVHHDTKHNAFTLGKNSFVKHPGKCHIKKPHAMSELKTTIIKLYFWILLK